MYRSYRGSMRTKQCAMTINEESLCLGTTAIDANPNSVVSHLLQTGLSLGRLGRPSSPPSTPRWISLPS